jgi:hypothetical protein
MKKKLIAPPEHGADTLSSPFPLQRVNLPRLAALTPPGHMMTIVEESFAPDDMNNDADLMSITVMTELALRAYHIPIPIGVETYQGCPYDCEFCCAGRILGWQYRVGPVPEVLPTELERTEYADLQKRRSTNNMATLLGRSMNE